MSFSLYAVALATAAIAAGPGQGLAADGGPDRDHCVTPFGEDLNEVFATPDALITPFCGEAGTGQRWRPVARLVVAGDDPVFPEGYEPSRPALDDDFLAKLESVRFVVDEDTARERQYEFAASDLALQRGVLPDGSRFIRFASPSLHPLPPGDHSVASYTTLSGELWDGLGLEPGVNSIPAGESALVPLEFSVVTAHKR